MYLDTTDSSTGYAAWTGTAWQFAKFAIGTEPGLAVDSLDRSYIAAGIGGMVYWDGSAWRAESYGVPAPTRKATVDFNSTGFPVIAWGGGSGLYVSFSAPPVAPGAPRNLAATAGNGQVVLTWAVPASNGGSPITAYRVYRGTSSGGETFRTALGVVLTFTDTGLTNGVTYWYTVTAVNAIGEGPPSNEASATPNSPPTLSGGSVTPASGTPSTDFLWQVTYADAENQAPASGDPRVHIRKAAAEIAGSPFPMVEVDPLDTTYTDGKTYRYNRTLALEGTDYSYYFSAKDSLNLAAANTPAASGPMVAVPHTPPTLTWTGEPGYLTEGVDPDQSFRSSTFTFRVRYADADNATPTAGTPRLEIRKGGTAIAGSPFSLTRAGWIGAPDDWIAGAIFSTPVSLPGLGADYSYRFTGSDSRDPAGGNATAWTAGPEVVDRPPALDWTGEAGYASDGVNPDTGTPATTFKWRIRYTDLDNDAPTTWYPKVHILANGTEISNSPFALGQVDPADVTYSDGKLYSFTGGLPLGPAYSYYFEAQSLSLSATTVTLAGPAVSAPPNAAPTVSLVSPVGGESWTIGTRHTITWTMDDPDTGASSLTAEVFLIDGANRQRIAGPGAGLTAYDWVPALEVYGARVQVVVTDPGGLNATATGGPFDVLPVPGDTTPPVARFTTSPAEPLAGDAVAFDGSSSTDDSGTIASYSWSVYDPGGSLIATYSGATPSHTFASPGTYRVVLNVTDTAGNWDVKSQIVIVSSTPSAPAEFPVAVVGGIAVVVVVVAALFILLRKRRKAKEPR